MPPIRTTPCGHNFCERCLDRIANGQQNWSCPQSRQVHNIAVESLPRNFLIERFVEKFKKNQEGLEKSGTTELVEVEIAKIQGKAIHTTDKKATLTCVTPIFLDVKIES